MSADQALAKLVDDLARAEDRIEAARRARDAAAAAAAERAAVALEAVAVTVAHTATLNAQARAAAARASAEGSSAAEREEADARRAETLSRELEALEARLRAARSETALARDELAALDAAHATETASAATDIERRTLGVRSLDAAAAAEESGAAEAEQRLAALRLVLHDLAEAADLHGAAAARLDDEAAESDLAADDAAARLEVAEGRVLSATATRARKRAEAAAEAAFLEKQAEAAETEAEAGAERAAEAADALSKAVREERSVASRIDRSSACRELAAIEQVTEERTAAAAAMRTAGEVVIAPGKQAPTKEDLVRAEVLVGGRAAELAAALAQLRALSKPTGRLKRALGRALAEGEGAGGDVGARYAAEAARLRAEAMLAGKPDPGTAVTVCALPGPSEGAARTKVLSLRVAALVYSRER